MKNIGKLLARSRKLTGKTQREFADIMDVSFRTIQNWEADKTEMKLSDLNKYAKICGYEMGHFVGVVQNVDPIPRNIIKEAKIQYGREIDLLNKKLDEKDGIISALLEKIKHLEEDKGSASLNHSNMAKELIDKIKR